MFFSTVKDFRYEKKMIRHGQALLAAQKFWSTTATNSNTDEYEYIQMSKTPTMNFQKSLPHLNVPSLESSCNKYLRAQQPLLSESEYQKTASYVSKFVLREGVRVQERLKDLDRFNRDTNYVSKHWFDMYLRDRRPLPINYNPMLVLSQEDDAKYNDQLVKATNIVISALRFMKSLRNNLLAPEVFCFDPCTTEKKLFYVLTRYSPAFMRTFMALPFKAFPLDMSQYHNLFYTTRVPQLDKDKICEADPTRHIVVMRKGHFYSFNVLDEDGYIHDPKQIAANLRHILSDNAPPNKVPVGVLTTCERNEWAELRSHLIAVGNGDVLNVIDSAIFALNLDDAIMGNDNLKLGRNYLHADGTNRWFDKSFSLIITKDGYSGINFEHSWGDGVAVLRFLKDIKEDMSKKPRFHPHDVAYLDQKNSDVVKLEFNTDGKIENAVNTGKAKYAAWTDSLSIDYTIYDGFGKEQCKRLQVSPDAIMQLCFQLAIYNQRGHVVPTYESCSTAIFKHGRTETLRPCTVQTKALCAAMSEKNSSSGEGLRSMISNCSKAHVDLLKAAAMGKGFDRHLFVLKRMLEESNEPLPDIFNDPAYESLNRNVLSTSTLSSPEIIAGGFGPTIPEGYGIGYMIQDNRLGTVVTSYKRHGNASDYVKSLEAAFSRIHQVLTRGQ